MQTRRSLRSSGMTESTQSPKLEQVPDVPSSAAPLPSPVSEPNVGTLSFPVPTIESGSKVTTQSTTAKRSSYKRKSSPSGSNKAAKKPKLATSQPEQQKSSPASQPARAAVPISPEHLQASRTGLELLDHVIEPSPALLNTTIPLSTRGQEDQAFVNAVVLELSDAETEHVGTIGHRQTKRVLGLLRIARPAAQEDGPWLTEEEAIAIVKPGNLHAGPIFVEKQQPHKLVTVNDFLTELCDDTAAIWVQDSAAEATGGTAREVSVGEVKQRLAGPLSQQPWNCLELASPIEDGIRPRFLNSRECRLLTKIKVPLPRKGPKRAVVGRRSLMPGYKEVEKWVLLAEAGALTEPHQDSHGYNTYITINEGSLGFGWLHQPTTDERQAWMENPISFHGGSWRYVVLRPGQTVYFPAGTVHFVFRLRSAGHTLAFGGHVLRCSTIVPWAEALLLEKKYPYIANEELTEAVLGFLERIEKFVLQAKASNDNREVDCWGGLASIDRFLVLKKTFHGARRSR